MEEQKQQIKRFQYWKFCLLFGTFMPFLEFPALHSGWEDQS